MNRTPDLQKLLGDQSRLMAAATAAGEAVARDIGTYANKKRDEAQKLARDTNDPALKAKFEQEAKDWSEGGDYRALMHTAGGAIVAGLGGGNALGGALGAGATSKLGKVLDNLSDQIRDSHPTGNADIDQALAQIVTTSVGTAVGAAAGGSSGAFTGFNTDRYNRQLSKDEPTLAKYIAEKSKGRYTQQEIEDQMRIMGVSLVGAGSVPEGTAEELNGRTPTDPGAKWINTGFVNENGKPLIIQSLVEPNQELQAFIMQNYNTATPGQIPSPFTYIPTPPQTNIRETVADAAGAVSTAAGRFGAITSAGASLPSPFAPGLATAAYVATATGVAADAVVQMAKPDVGQYWTNGGSSMISDYFSQKYRLASPIINEATNVFNDSEYSKSIQDFINSYWGKLREKLDKK